jgi:hypothetical protein
VLSQADPLPWSSESQHCREYWLARAERPGDGTMWGKLWGTTQGQMRKLEENGGLAANSQIARSAVNR